jgi:hypothetical protein
MIKLRVARIPFQRWVSFSFFALSISMLLALRPITSISSGNDTGRYISEMYAYCSGQFSQTGFNVRSFSFMLMYELTGSCLLQSERFFLFLTAFFTPAAYLCFAEWKRGDWLIAAAATLSIYGFEMMTNALRTGFALFFFMGALYNGRSRLFTSAALFAIAGLIHNSLIVLFPMLYYQWYVSLPGRAMQIMNVLLMLLIGLMSIANPLGINGLFNYMFDLTGSYREIYAINLNPSFTIFMVAPLLIAFLMRATLTRAHLTGLESFAFLYSSLLIGAAYALFPYITFRLAMICFPIQLFLIVLSGKSTWTANNVIFGVLLVHLLTMLLLSNNYEYLWQ